MDATHLGNELIELHDHPRQVPPFSARYPGLTAESGYGAARRLHAHRIAQGWKPTGRKIGFTNRTLWDRYGVHEPMWGTVYDRTAHTSPRTTGQPFRSPASCSRASSPRSASGLKARAAA